MKAATPSEWFKKSSPEKIVYFARQPVPGIYTITAKGKRYLVTIKPKRKKDIEHIFRVTERSNDSTPSSNL